MDSNLSVNLRNTPSEHEIFSFIMANCDQVYAEPFVAQNNIMYDI